MIQRVSFMTDKERQNLLDNLFAEKCSCVIRQANEVRVFHERGVKDLYRLLREEPDFLKDSFIADKVVGKAAAALIILGGVKEVFANVISQQAYKLLSQSHIQTEYRLMVPHIINRSQTDWCPLERRCTAALTAEACLPIIDDFFYDFIQMKK